MPVEGEQAEETSAGDLARDDVPACRPDEPVSEILQRFDESGWDFCVVVDDDRVVLGLLTRDRLAGEARATAGQVMEEGPLTTRLDTSADGVRDRMESSDTEYLLVTGNFGTLAGAIRRQDLSKSNGQAS